MLYTFLYIMRPRHLQSLKLLRPTVKEMVQLQETRWTDIYTHKRMDGPWMDNGPTLMQVIIYLFQKSGYNKVL